MKDSSKINFQDAKNRYLTYLTQYSGEIVHTPDSITKFHVLQTFEFTAKNEWLEFQASFREKKLTLDVTERFNLYTDLKKDFYSLIKKYMDFYYDQYTHISNKFKGMGNNEVNPYNKIQKPFNDWDNPWTVMLSLCIETKKEIELLNILSPQEELLNKANLKATFVNKIIEAIMTIFKGTAGMFLLL